MARAATSARSRCFASTRRATRAKLLRGLVIDGDEPVAAGAVIKHPAKRPRRRGHVVGRRDGDGTTLALGYLHRTTWEVGGTVQIDGRRATVHELPW